LAKVKAVSNQYCTYLRNILSLPPQGENMKKFIFIAVVLMFSGRIYACPYERAEVRALQAGLFIEGLNGGTPLTYEVHSLSSRPNTWGVILSYSGVQNVHLVTIEPRSCRVLGIATMPEKRSRK
jgi:hypothetical protein